MLEAIHGHAQQDSFHSGESDSGCSLLDYLIESLRWKSRVPSEDGRSRRQPFMPAKRSKLFYYGKLRVFEFVRGLEAISRTVSPSLENITPGSVSGFWQQSYNVSSPDCCGFAISMFLTQNLHSPSYQEKPRLKHIFVS